MQVTLRYFAALRELSGTNSESVDLPDGATVADARSVLEGRSPAWRATLATCSVAVNQAHSDFSRKLERGDEVAFLPPVGGG